MPAVDAVIVAAIVTALLIFAGMLAWAEHQTRIYHLDRADEAVALLDNKKPQPGVVGLRCVFAVPTRGVDIRAIVERESMANVFALACSSLIQR